MKTKAAILLLSHGGAHSANIAYIAGKVTPLLDVQKDNYFLDLDLFRKMRSAQCLYSYVVR